MPPGAVYGYDVEAFVGLERFISHRQREEIRDRLSSNYGISLSSGEVSVLARRFLEHLAALHASRSPALRQALEGDGGYPLHFDASGEDGRGTLLVVYAGWREWVLGAWKLPTERADQITPCLLEVAERFGPPCAIMRDLGRAARAAAKDFVSKLKLRTVPVLSCHFHFLADVGKDLLKAAHDKLRNFFRGERLRPDLRAFVRDLGRKLGADLDELREEVLHWAKDETSGGHLLPEGRTGLVTLRALAQWVLDSARDGEHLGFPFERPYLDLYERARKARRVVDAFLRKPPADKALRRALTRLARLLDPIRAVRGFAETAKALSACGALFDELRDAMRLDSKPSHETSPAPSAEKAAAELSDIRRALDRFERSLCRRRPARGPAEDTRQAIDLVLEHLKRHGRSLWGHVIELGDDAGGGIRVVDRTNNILESLFHRIKHGERRRSGRKVLTDDFERLPAEAALTHNLTKNDYVELLCGSLDDLPAAFADLDFQERQRLLVAAHSEPKTSLEEPHAEFASLPRGDRGLVRSEPFGKRVEAAARSRAPQRSAVG